MIILFDLDSTISTIEGCDWLASRKGVGEQVAAITKATMDGTMDFDQAFVGKTSMVAPSISDQDDLGIYYNQNLDSGITQIISHLQNIGYIIGILMQGYRNAALHVAQQLGISEDMVFGLVFEYDQDGSYVNFPDQILKYESGKKNTVLSLQQQYPGEKIVVIGDSVSDLHAGEAADLFVGYGGVVVREKVKSQAKYFVTDAMELYDKIQSY